MKYVFDRVIKHTSSKKKIGPSTVEGKEKKKRGKREKKRDENEDADSEICQKGEYFQSFLHSIIPFQFALRLSSTKRLIIATNLIPPSFHPQSNIVHLNTLKNAFFFSLPE